MQSSKQGNGLHVGLVGPLPPPFGGMANQMKQLARLLRAEGVTISVVQTNAEYRPKLIGGVKGVRAMFRLFPYLFQLWKVVGQVDVLHVLANSGWSWQLFAAPAIWIGYLRGKPVVVNYRGGFAEEYFEKSISRVRPAMIRARALVVPSPFLREVFSTFGFDAEVIPNIIDLQRFYPRGRPKGECGPHIVIARNLESIYGISSAIRSVAKVKPEFPGLKVSIAGSGPQEQELKALSAELGLADAVVFTGRLTPDEVAELYREADLMLNPTTVDNMPNSVLEGLASGLPIITTNVGGIPYVVADEVTALFVDSGDVEGMADQIKRLIGDADLRSELINNGLKEVQRYSWAVVRDQWLGLYRRLLT